MGKSNISLPYHCEKEFRPRSTIALIPNWVIPGYTSGPLQVIGFANRSAVAPNHYEL